MSAGIKTNLYPIYKALLAINYDFREKYKTYPYKTIIPFLYRDHVFAQIKSITRNRIDVGLSLGNMEIPSRLNSTGSYKRKMKSPTVCRLRS